MDEVIKKLEELHDEHYWQACGLQGACDEIAEWHFGYAQAIEDVLEDFRKIKDAP